MKIDITKREEINHLLKNLKEDTQPKWGLMKPQNMIEHLLITLQYSNGKKQISQRTTEEEGLKAKQAVIYSDVALSKGMKSPLLGEGPAPFEFATLDEAKNNLNKELDAFELYYEDNPNATCIQPRLGPLNKNEWIILHSKHFTHHFQQFGLIEES